MNDVKSHLKVQSLFRRQMTIKQRLAEASPAFKQHRMAERAMQGVRLVLHSGPPPDVTDFPPTNLQ